MRKYMLIIGTVTIFLSFLMISSGWPNNPTHENSGISNNYREILNHSGQTDANGCHTDSNGVFHCHR